MKKEYLPLIIIGAIVLIAVITNPGPERHKEAVKVELNKLMQNKLSDSGEGVEAFGSLVGGALIDRMVDNVVSSDSYLLFSTTKVTWDGNSRVVGIGAFGNVYITGK